MLPHWFSQKLIRIVDELNVIIRLVLCLFLVPGVSTQSEAQYDSFQFSDSLESVFRYVDHGRFDEANQLLSNRDSTSRSSISKERADFYFARGYYNLFLSGKIASLDDFSRAGRIYTELGEDRFVRLVEVYMVIDLYVKSHWDEAKRRSLELRESLPAEEVELLAMLNNIIAACYCGHPVDPVNGQLYGNLAVNYFKQNNNDRRLISVYGILAACMAGSDDFVKTLQYIDSAMMHAERINHEKQLAFLHIRKAILYKDQLKVEEALFELQKAHDYFIEHPTEQGQIEWITTLKSQVYALNKDFKSAYDILESRRIQKAKHRSKELDEQINQIMIKYETAQKQHQIEIQQLQIENQQHRIQNQVIIGVGILVALMSIFGFLSWRNKEKHLQRQRNAELAHQRKVLEATVSTIEAERKRISQDLHDGVGQKLTGLKMAWEQMLDVVPMDLKERVKDVTNVLQEATSEIRGVSHQLMPASLRKLGLIPAIEDCLEQTLTFANIQYDFEHFDVSQRYDERVEIGLYRVIQELLNNTVKHADANRVEMQLYKSKNQLIFSMQDDGKGFDYAKQKNSGNGLFNIESRIKSMNGFVAFDRRERHGMLITIRLPIDN